MTKHQHEFKQYRDGGPPVCVCGAWLRTVKEVVTDQQPTVDRDALARELCNQYGPGWFGIEDDERDTWRDEAAALLRVLRLTDAAQVPRPRPVFGLETRV